MSIESLINEINRVNEANEAEYLSDQQKLTDTILDAQALEIRRLQETVEEVVAEKAVLISQLFQAKKKLRKISDADSMKDFRTAISEAEAFLAVMDRAHYDNQF